jgi:hypothetical protein
MSPHAVAAEKPDLTPRPTPGAAPTPGSEIRGSRAQLAPARAIAHGMMVSLPFWVSLVLLVWLVI